MSTTPHTQNVPSSLSLRLLKWAGQAVVIFSIIACFYVLFTSGSKVFDLVFGYDDLTKDVLVEFLWAPVLAVAGALLWILSARRHRYWHEAVLRGVIVQKDIHHHSEYSVSYVIFIKGTTRAGTTNTYGRSVPHGDYEEYRKGQFVSFS